MRKVHFKRLISICLSLLIFMYSWGPSLSVSAEAATAPAAENIIVKNNYSTGDIVEVSNLTPGDIVKIYKTATSLTPMTKATVAAEKTSVTIEIAQIATSATASGTIYVSVESAAKLESTRTAKKYDSETTVAPSTMSITVTNNNTGEADTVKVTDLETGDTVKVYTASTGGVMKSAIVAAEAMEATISEADLLTPAGGTVYVSLTKANKAESPKAAKKYTSQATSTAPAAENITITNSKTTVADTVIVTGLAEGDIVKAYSASSGGTLVVESSPVATGETKATISEADALTPSGGTLYVTVTSKDKLESPRTAKKFESEVTAAPLAAAITVTNNKTGDLDTVEVTGLEVGDVVNVYTASSGVTPKSATVASGATKATVSEIDLLTAAGGTVYVTLTKVNKTESTKTAIKYTYQSQAVTTAPAAENIIVKNNIASKSDTVQVSNLAAGNIVKVYNSLSAITPLAKATVAAEQTAVTIEMAQIATSATASGTIYVSVESADKLESTRTAKKYDSETTTAPLATVITVVNNKTGDADTVKVTGLEAGDVIKVYKAATGTLGSTVAGTATVASGANEATVSVVDLLTSEGGTIYVTCTKTNKAESPKTAKKYITQPTSTAPAVANITITNSKTSLEDVVEVTGLAEGDVVKIYSAASSGSLIYNEATVATGAIKVTFSKLNALIPTGGTLYVTVTSKDKLESLRTAKKYDAEAVTAPNANNIVVLNNDAGNDIVRVTGLAAGDIVTVYNVSSGGTALGSATVVAGKTSVNVTIAQIGTTAGKVYITITKTGKAESTRTAKDYIAE